MWTWGTWYKCDLGAVQRHLPKSHHQCHPTKEFLNKILMLLCCFRFRAFAPWTYLQVNSIGTQVSHHHHHHFHRGHHHHHHHHHCLPAPQHQLQAPKASSDSWAASHSGVISTILIMMMKVMMLMIIMMMMRMIMIMIMMMIIIISIWEKRCCNLASQRIATPSHDNSAASTPVQKCGWYIFWNHIASTPTDVFFVCTTYGCWLLLVPHLEDFSSF